MLKYQKSAGFIRVARYPYGGLGCDAALNTAFEKPKYSPFGLFKIWPLIRTLHWRSHEIGAITVTPETWPPLARVLKL